MLDDQFADDLAEERGGRRRRGRIDPMDPDADNTSPATDPGSGTGGGGTGDAPPTDPWAGAPKEPAPPKPKTYAQIAGLDLAKLQNEGYNSYKYNAGSRALSSYIGGGSSIKRGQLDDFVAYARANGNPNAKAVGDDKIDFGDGSGPVDIISGKDESLWWGQEGPGGGGETTNPGTLPTAGGAPPVWSAGGGGGGGFSPYGGGNTNAAGTGLEDLLAKLIAGQDEDRASKKAFSDRMRSTLLTRMDAAGKPIDENSPDLAALRKSFAGGQARMLSEGREAMAARAAAEGTPTGSFDASLQSSYENAGKDRGAYDASILSKKYSDQLAEMQNLLQTGAGIMTADETNALQGQIAAIQARLKDLDLQQSGAIAGRSLDLQSQGLGLDQQRINNQNNQWYDNFGLQIGDRESALNEQLTRMLTGR